MANEYDVNKSAKLSALKLLAQRTDTRLDSLESKAATLIGSDANKSVRTIANEELAAQLIPESAKESLDTLAEIAAWIQNHPDDASAMNTAITKLQGIVAGIGGTSDDYATVLAAIEGMVEAAEYEHPTATAVAAALRKIGCDAQGHVVIGDTVTKADITTLVGLVTTTADDIGFMSAADKAKLDGIATGATKVEASTTNGNIKVNGTETTVVEFATDAEVNAMLDDVFGTTSES